MTNQFLEKPILSSPYAHPVPHWRLDETGQPTRQIINKRRPAEFTIPKVDSSKTDEIACWFVNTDYNEERLFVRQVCFLRANDPYKERNTVLKAEINEETWATLYGGTSRVFDKPQSGRIAVKVINHLGG